MLQFEYPEDREFFCEQRAGGNSECFDREFAHYFDFRSPKIKRHEFNAARARLLAQFLASYGEVCQLKDLHPDCSKEKIWELDHYIPLSSNHLNPSSTVRFTK